MWNDNGTYGTNFVRKSLQISVLQENPAGTMYRIW